MKPSTESLNACLFDASVENFHKLAISCVESYSFALGYYDFFNVAPNRETPLVCKMHYRGKLSDFKFVKFEADGTLCFSAKAIAEVEGDDYCPSEGNALTQSLVKLIKTDIADKMLADLRKKLNKQLAPFCDPSSVPIKVTLDWQNKFIC